MQRTVRSQLCQIVGPDHCLVADAVQSYSRDASFHEAHPPDVVVLPKTTLEVQAIVRVAATHRMPLTAWGAGSSLEGNPIPVQGGIIVDMRRMNAILDVQPENFSVRVQPGIVGDDFNKQLQPHGLFFPAQPGSSSVATIGGMIANNAGGMQAVRYGVVGDWVLQLQVVTASAEILWVGSRSFKSVAGYDLKRLFIGSAGTLGVITEAVVKVAPLPRYRSTYLISFPTVDLAGRAIQAVLHQGLAPASLELMDAYNIVLLNQFKELGWKEDPTVIVEFHEREPVSAASIACLKSVITDHQGTLQIEAIDDVSRMNIWKARWSIRPAIRSLFPDVGILPGDVGLPIGSIPAYLDAVRKLSGKYAVKTVTFGHAGDGNFHTWILYTVGDAKSLAKAKKLGEALITFALACGGTCTAEHGVGMGKRQYLALEHPTDMALMKKIKDLLDPSGILNPGKIFP